MESPCLSFYFSVHLFAFFVCASHFMYGPSRLQEEISGNYGWWPYPKLRSLAKVKVIKK